jgi:uncharacterized protein Veg
MENLFDLHRCKVYTKNSEVVAMGKTLTDIKKSLDGNLGRRLTLKANGGRRKTIERCGVLAETYPSVFVIELDQDENSFERVSYSYADVLTETVQLTFFEDTTGSFAVSGQ